MKEVTMLRLQRVYDDQGDDNGERYLVERLWPRGIKKEDLPMKAWLKEVAPSTELRRWFDHDPAKWEEFQHRYRAELDEKPDVWERLVEAGKRGTVTLLYSSHDRQHNNAVVLKSYLEEQLKII
jgi:uncharacterized protein YeaO (DUF488 family)